MTLRVRTEAGFEMNCFLCVSNDSTYQMAAPV